jgi:alkanesulfonate monooxygenase SsuD/methylene tetrahydromethanopterin reductase-like flavin-dependent oxidoreductase (luciferase family)
MRSLWEGGPSTFEGEFVSFTGAYCRPTPARGRELPVHFGGESEPALRRVARLGNGWHALNVTPDEVRAALRRINEMAADHGRTVNDIEIVVGPTNAGGGTLSMDEMRAYRDAGVDELSVIDVYQPSADAAGIEAWVEDLAEKWVVPAREVGARERTFELGA